MLRPLVIPHDSRRDLPSGSRQRLSGTQRLPVTQRLSGTQRLPVTLRLLVTALLLAMVGFVLAPASSASASESGTIHSLVNQSRAAAGLAPLNRNSALDQVAANWANQLAASGQLAHNPSYSAQIPGGWTNAGENVAQGQPTGVDMHNAWMSSPGHRANILGGFTDVGIAFITAGGTTWGVEVFAAYPGSAAPAPAPQAAASAPSTATQLAAQQAADAAAQQAAADAAARAAADAAAAAAATAQVAAQQAAEAAAAQAVIDEQRSAAEAEQTRVENRVTTDRVAALMTPAQASTSPDPKADAAVRFVSSPGSLVAVGLALIAVISHLVGRGPFRLRFPRR